MDCADHFFAFGPDYWIEFFDVAECESWIEPFALAL